MRNWYGRRIDEWEKQLAFRATNRVVRPFDWGVEWTRGWPQGVPVERPFAGALPAGSKSGGDGEQRPVLRLREADGFSTRRRYSAIHHPGPYTLSGERVVHARYFPAKGNKAVVLLPHWNAPADGHLGLCRGLAKAGYHHAADQPALSRFPDAAGTPASRLRRLFEHRANYGCDPAGRHRCPLLLRLVGDARLRSLRDRRHKPGFMLCLPGVGP